MVVVDHDKPQGVILWTNERARQHAVVPGMRYAAGLSLARDLCGGVLTDLEISEATAQLTQEFWQFSPHIEPSPQEVGIFWLDASGLRPIYPSLEDWAAQVRDGLRLLHFQAVIAVGFSRFGSYAAARTLRKNRVFTDPCEEHAFIQEVPVECLIQDPAVCANLLKLGIRTLGRFLELPPAGIRKRFGAQAGELHQLARGDLWSPLTPALLREPVDRAETLDFPETNTDRLLFKIAAMLRPLLAELAARHEALKTLRFRLVLDDAGQHEEEIAPASPTLESRPILVLVRLRLETVTLSAGVAEIHLHAEGTGLSERQLDLLQEAPQRNHEAALRAFAALRAELGNDAVLSVHLHDGHLPEARYKLEALTELPMPAPRQTGKRPLARRIYTPPRPLPPRTRHEPDGWLVAGVAEGPVEEVIGPQIVSGGWWMRELHRSYYYVRTRSGRWLWIFYDRNRRRWYLHGEVQ